MLMGQWDFEAWSIFIISNCSLRNSCRGNGWGLLEVQSKGKYRWTHDITDKWHALFICVCVCVCVCVSEVPSSSFTARMCWEWFHKQWINQFCYDLEAPRWGCVPDWLRCLCRQPVATLGGVKQWGIPTQCPCDAQTQAQHACLSPLGLLPPLYRPQCTEDNSNTTPCP